VYLRRAYVKSGERGVTLATPGPGLVATAYLILLTAVDATRAGNPRRTRPLIGTRRIGRTSVLCG
jgi:hypothetical protein